MTTTDTTLTTGFDEAADRRNMVEASPARRLADDVLRNLRFMIQAKNVRRWHQHFTTRPDMGDGHAWSVIGFCMLLEAQRSPPALPSAALLMHAHAHDMGEGHQGVGDIAAPVKRMLQAKHVDINMIEWNVVEAHWLKLPPLSEEDATTLHMADMLDGFAYTRAEKIRGNTTASINDALWKYRGWLVKALDDTPRAAAIFNVLDVRDDWC